MSRESIIAQCRATREAFDLAPLLSTASKNAILRDMASALVRETPFILAENALDLARGKDAGIDPALLDRLALTEARIAGMADGVKMVATLPDPVSELIEEWTVEKSGLHIQKIRVPIGVVGIIYEARPNVTVDAASLCFKTGNAVVLRGSSSAVASNRALVSVLHGVLRAHDVSVDLITLLEDTSREGVDDFVRMTEFLNVVIPRGGASLIAHVVKTATVPSIETGAGNCHIFVDREADLGKAIPIIVNAKTQRPSVCNALETVLIHAKVADGFLPVLADVMASEGVVLHGDEEAVRIVPTIVPATESDFTDEYLNLNLAVKIVSSLAEAEAHIRQYGTHHTEVILTEDAKRASHFTASVNAAVVGVNVSTRFTDGGEFGFGAEIGISTQMLHARGPMGLRELTSYKFVLSGDHLSRI